MLARAGCSKMPRKSFPNRSRKPPGTSRSSLWPSWGSFCPSWGSFGASWGSFWTSFGPPGTLLGFSLGALGSLWGASWPSKSSRRLSRRPPAPELNFRSILGAILAPFWHPPDLKKHGFRVEGVAFFEKSRGSRKSPKNTSKPKPDYHGTGSARGERAYKHCKQGESSESSNTSQRPSGRITKRSKGESGEGRPRLETASAYYRL